MQIIPFHPENFSKIIAHVNAGLPTILPTDTCYGFSGSIFSEYAISLVERIKGRENKPFLILVKDLVDMSKFGNIKNIQSLEKIQKEGTPTTFLLPKTSAIPKEYFPDFPEIGIRVPIHFPPLLGLLNAYTKPLFSTSANISGFPAIYFESEIIKNFSDFPEILFATAGNLPVVPASSILRLKENGEVEKIR